MTSLLTDAELAAKGKEFKSLEKKLTERDESIGCMNDEINRQRQQMAVRRVCLFVSITPHYDVAVALLEF